MKRSFEPIHDDKLFPILASCPDCVWGPLMACEKLSFFAPIGVALSESLRRALGRNWDRYGDTRWPHQACWVEFKIQTSGFHATCGVLVQREDLPDDEEDPLAWCAYNNPLAALLPTERSEKAMEERLKTLRTQATADSYGNGPSGGSVAATQSYCLFVSEKEKRTKSVGFYSDILDQDGQPITAFRMASVSTIQVPLCRLVLHSLFWLNEARLAGGDFPIAHQLGRFSASNLVEGKSNPRWAQFHPMRTLRTRRQLRNAPNPVMMRDGILNLEDYERINDLIRRETCAHLLAFER